MKVRGYLALRLLAAGRLGAARSGEWKEPHLARQEVAAPKQDQNVAQELQGVSHGPFHGEEGL